MVTPATTVVMNNCSNQGCRKRPVVAERLSDFWVTKCADCAKLPQITLDIARIQSVFSVPEQTVWQSDTEREE
jgi:hypothetical protein